MDKAKLRKNTPTFSGCLMYFPNAIKYVSQVSRKGNEQHHPDEPLHWDMSKSTDEADALTRHLIDAGPEWDNFDDDGILHAGKVAWRALAMLERILAQLSSEKIVEDNCDTYGGCGVMGCKNNIDNDPK